MKHIQVITDDLVEKQNSLVDKIKNINYDEKKQEILLEFILNKNKDKKCKNSNNR